MSTAEPPYANLARSIISNLSESEKHANSSLEPAFAACNCLSAPLTPLMGVAGYQAIISRALAVARLQTEGLSEVEVGSNGALTHSGESSPAANRSETMKAGTTLLGSFITLLVAFIGENLTFRIISDVWPSLEHPNLNFSKETKNEQSN